MDDLLLDFLFWIPPSPGQRSWPLPVDLMGGFRLVFLDCGCCLFLVFDQSLLQSSSCLSHGVFYTTVTCNVVPQARGKYFLVIKDCTELNKISFLFIKVIAQSHIICLHVNKLRLTASVFWLPAIWFINLQSINHMTWLGHSVAFKK